jgi:hypothetical protein
MVKETDPKNKIYYNISATHTIILLIIPYQLSSLCGNGHHILSLLEN